MNSALQIRRRRRSGQTLVFLLMLCVILALVALWNFDLHKILTVKWRAQNGGDAAALAAARWQGIALNLIGHLNILQAVAIGDGLARGQTDFPEAEAIAGLAARLSYVGPMTALAAAQLGAKNNGIHVNNGHTQTISRHGATVIGSYADRFPARPYENAPEPPTAWDDYGAMLIAIAGQGIAAMPDNPRYYVDYSGDHLLLNPSFYDAVASRNWCWFHHHARRILRDYTSYADWDPLPIVIDPEPVNAEYFSLGLFKLAHLDSLPMIAEETDDAREAILLMEQLSGRSITSAVAEVSAQWYCYSPDRWRTWSGFIPEGFPFRSPIREQFDYVGADAAVRIETTADRMTPGAAGRHVVWSAAAKPFGSLEGPVRPNRYGLVLPAFTDVRLIPVDAATGGGGGSRPGWSEHYRTHLEEYTLRGTGALVPGCWYCEQLLMWESSTFRQTGIAWLDEHSHRCRIPGTRPGDTGGARRGH